MVRRTELNRRRFIQAVGGGVLALTWTAHASPRFSAMLAVLRDGSVQFTLPCAEMGQGIGEALAAAIVEELDVPWSAVEILYSGADTAFNNPRKGYQSTGQSMSVRGYFLSLRQLGAAARALMIEEAADRLQVAREELETKDGRVLHVSTGRELDYGALTSAAAARRLPVDPPLRSPDQFQKLGHSLPSKSAAEIVTGKTTFASDIKLAGQWVATVQQARTRDGSLSCTNLDELRTLPGVKAAFVLPAVTLDIRHPAALVVAAESFWQARRAMASAIVVEDPAVSGSTGRWRATRLDLLGQAGMTVQQTTDHDDTMEPNVVADYEVPYLAHATMEPMTCSASVNGDKCELWAPTQGPFHLRKAVGQALSIASDNVVVHRMRLGGGFGRRWYTDFGVQAARIAAHLKRPIQLVWSREEDFQHDFYRPAVAMRFAAKVSPSGEWQGFEAKLVVESILESAVPGRLGGRPDPTVLGTFADVAYDLPPHRLGWIPEHSPMPLGLWRSVGHSFGGFFLESAVDECAHAAGVNPYQFRRARLNNSPRTQHVLDLAAAAIDWDAKRPSGRGCGIASMRCYDSHVAHAVEVEVKDNRLRIVRVVCVADCGQPLSLNGLRAQLEGGTLFGLSAALFEQVSYRDGRVVASNFHNYRLLRISEAPPVDVSIVASHEQPGGGGEVPVPTIAPALTNAIFSAVGRRVRRLPLSETFTIEPPRTPLS